MYTLSARALNKQFVSGEISAKEIAEHFIKRIKTHNDSIGAFLTILEARTLEKASELDEKRARGEPLGRLAGIPIAIKDNIHMQGITTTCGSQFLTQYKAPFDASCIKLLEDEGALLIGKTLMDEFAMGSTTENTTLGKVANPWDLECVAGGSSGGSAAAVAARLCPLALGSDTGGSIRQPAALTGTVGFKPTYGRVSRYGLVAFASSLDQIGPFATSVEDTALIMEVLGQHCPHDATSLQIPNEPYLTYLRNDLKGVTIGVPWQFIKDLSAESRAQFEESLRLCTELGATIKEVDLDILKTSISVYYIIATAEASTNLARFDGIRYGHRSKKATTLDEVYLFSKQEGFGAEVKRRILLGTYVLSSGYQNAYYKKAQQVRRKIFNSFMESFSGCDLIAMPTVPVPYIKIGALKDPLQAYLQDIYTIGANLAGLPAISIPSGLYQGKYPCAIQMIAPAGHDAKLLGYAHAFDVANGSSRNIPKNFDL